MKTHQQPPLELTISAEAGTYPLAAPEKADLIGGSIGEKSPFHETFGYYAHGVAPETAVLPANWQRRWVPVNNENTRGVTGRCLGPADLAISKLAAGREKDLQFVTALLRHRFITPEDVRKLFSELQDSQVPLVAARLERCQAHALLN